MAQLPHDRDYSIPAPSGFQLGTNGVRVPFPQAKRGVIPEWLHNLKRHVFPSPDLTSHGGAAQPSPPLDPNRDQTKPVPYINPRWYILPPLRGNPTVMAVPGVLKKGE